MKSPLFLSLVTAPLILASCQPEGSANAANSRVESNGNAAKSVIEIPAAVTTPELFPDTTEFPLSPYTVDPEVERYTLTSDDVLGEVVETLGLIDRWGANSKPGAVSELRNRVTVKPLAGGRLMEIAVTGTAREESAQLANAVVEAYKTHWFDRRSDQANACLMILDRELNNQHDRVEQARVKMLDLMGKYGIDDLEPESPGCRTTAIDRLRQLELREQEASVEVALLEAAQDRGEKPAESGEDSASPESAELEAARRNLEVLTELRKGIADRPMDERMDERRRTIAYTEAKNDYLLQKSRLERAYDAFLEVRIQLEMLRAEGIRVISNAAP